MITCNSNAPHAPPSIDIRHVKISRYWVTKVWTETFLHFCLKKNVKADICQICNFFLPGTFSPRMFSYRAMKTSALQSVSFFSLRFTWHLLRRSFATSTQSVDKKKRSHVHSYNSNSRTYFPDVIIEYKRNYKSRALVITSSGKLALIKKKYIEVIEHEEFN